MLETLSSDRFLNARDLALLLKKTVETIRHDVHRRPDTLPPRTILPGDARGLVWRQSDFEKWIASLLTVNEKEVEEKRGPGRPQICKQVAVQKRQSDTSSATSSGTLQDEEKPKNKGGRPRKADQIAAGRA